MKIPSVNISPRVQCGKTAGKTRVSVTQLNSKLHCRDFVRMVRPSALWPRVWPQMRQRVCLRKILRGALNLLPREQIENSRNFPREQFHHTAPEAFQQIVILTKSLQ